MNYKDAGVDIDASRIFTERIKSIARRTLRPEVISDIGGFSALCEIPTKYKQPLLVSGSDGVGTKLLLALKMNKHDTIGIDLVAMCANDLVTQGAEPLFFLDHYETSHLDVDAATEVVSGVAEGCFRAGCTLIGGEVAETPGMHGDKGYIVAGFCVGVVEKEDVIDGSKVEAGDVLIALGSRGLHSNGYSLVRRVIELSQTNIGELLGGRSVGEILLEPTRVYVKPILKLIEEYSVHAIVHITGGGFWENIPRPLPQKVKAVINSRSWQWPPIFKWLQKRGNIKTHEMYRTFNCGVGLVIVLPSAQAKSAINFLEAEGEISWLIGSISPRSIGDKRVEIW